VIAVTFALQNESRDFLRAVGNKPDRVAVFHTGVGAAICRQRIGSFLETQPQLEFLISSGFAGGVDPSLGVGDLFLAENYSDPALLERAQSILVARTARLASADDVVATAAARQEFAHQRNAAAVDMETEVIAAACAARNLPMLSLRAISDTAAAPFPAPPSILFDLTRQRTDARRLGGYLLRNPTGIVRLLRFARQIGTARANLAAGLIEFLAVS
jgi:adenosylhomocysteine nucleosidase